MSDATILIVEDEAVIAHDLELLLQDMGYHVPPSVATADAALAAAASVQPDLVLLDIRLADGSSGLDVAEQLHTQSDMPVIFLTAHADPATVARAQAASPYGYLLKPFNEREIAIAVQLTLAKSASDRQLRASERLFSTTLRSIDDGVIVTDTDLRITFLNRAAEHLTGWTLAEARGLPLSEVFAVRQFPDSDTRTLVARDGTQRLVDDALAPITHEHSQVDGMVAVFRDITARQRALEERQRMELAMLEAQRLESLGVLAGGIAHDFNNILMGVQGYVQITQDLQQPGDEAHHACQQALAGIQRASDLTAQMLAYAGRGHIVIRPVLLNRVVCELVELLHGSFVGRATLDMQLDATLPPVLADATQIHQIVLNLLTNAMEAVKSPGGLVRVETGRLAELPELPSVISFDRPAGAEAYVYLEVSDNGNGMDQATQAKIFDPFFSTKATGRGLGLAAVHGIVRRHSGALQVISTPGIGTRMRIYLPAAATARSLHTATPASAPQPAFAANVPRATVLVIDDDAEVRMVITRMLERLGYAVQSAPDGATGLALLTGGGQSFDAVLADLTMPGLSGAALIRALQQAAPHTRIVVMSGYHADEVASQHSDLGVAHVLQKPFRRADLDAAFQGVEGHQPTSS